MRFEIQGVMLYAPHKNKYLQPDLIEYSLNILNMFAIRIWYNENNRPDKIVIKRNNYKKEIGYTIQKKLQQSHN